MFQFVFITGTGRCGTNVLAGLLDGHSRIDVLPGEYTNFFGSVLYSNGLSPVVDLASTGTALLADVLDIFKGDDDYGQIGERLRNRFLELWQEGMKSLSANEFLSHICEAIFNKPDGTAVINLCNENIAGLLEAFPGCRVAHMLRNPMSQLNSRYRFRFGDANSFGGNYPGYWEFGKAFQRNYNSFKQAKAFKNHSRVFVLRLEDLQLCPDDMVAQVFQFLGETPEEGNFTPSRRGRGFEGTREGKRTSMTKVFVSKADWSCLSPNDLFFCGRISPAREFYDVPKFPFAKNSYLFFLRRQLGLIGKRRRKPRSPYRTFKIVVVSIAQYLQDECEKHYFETYLSNMSGGDTNIFSSSRK